MWEMSPCSVQSAQGVGRAMSPGRARATSAMLARTACASSATMSSGLIYMSVLYAYAYDLSTRILAPAMEDHQRRRDLAAMLQPLVRALIEAELPVLARHGITMWGYVVLNALDDAPASTQSALADKIGADKTRIIATLDDLQAAGLIARSPDPADRRARLLSIS